jgi:hypothetical protein
MVPNSFRFSRTTSRATLVGVCGLLFLAGCTGGGKDHDHPAAQETSGSGNRDAPDLEGNGKDEAGFQAERAKLSPEDQQLVAAQEFCAISTDEHLGVMGAPVKVMIEGQPVFLCCKGCKRQALAKPEQTLAKVAELKAKVKADAAK